MEDWKKIKDNGWFPKVAEIYGVDFPVQVRGILADFLKSEHLNCNPDNTSDHPFIHNFIDSLKTELNIRYQHLPDDDEGRFQYKETLRHQYKIFSKKDSMQLFRTIKQSIDREKQIVNLLQAAIDQCAQPASCMMVDEPQKEKAFAEVSMEMNAEIRDMQEQSFQIENGLQVLTRIYEEYLQSIHFSENLQEMIFQLQTSKASMESQIKAIFETLKRVHGKILLELDAYKDEQRLVALGKISDKNLSSFENWFKLIVTQIASLEGDYMPKFWRICERLDSQSDYSFDWVQNQIKPLRQAMMKACFVVETPPPQILRTETGFGPLKLRVLPFCSSMEKIYTSSKVDIVIIDEKSAHEVYEDNYNHGTLPKSALHIQKKTNEKQHGNIFECKKIFATKLKTKTEKEKDDSKTEEKQSILVSEERYWLYFRLKDNWTKDKTHHLWTLSLPIAVTCHTNQKVMAWANILWFNAFPTKLRNGLEAPCTISWRYLIEAINQPFIALGKGLSINNQSYLKEKMFGKEVPSDEMVSKGRFCDDELNIRHGPLRPRQGVSIAEWIYNCWTILCWKPSNSVSGIKKMEDFWVENKIIGFMATEDIEQRLARAPPKTFIIRFPENIPQHIGLYFYDFNATDPNKRLLKHLYTTSDFDVIPLEKRILENPVASYLCSESGVVKREVAFTNGMASSNDGIRPDGYFRTGVEEQFSRLQLERFKPTGNIPGPSRSSLPSFRFF